jgi:DNA (cytosine-5)-methyltransferase 1
MLRLQGFPDDFKINLSYSQLRKVVGNSVTVPVIQAIAQEILNSLNHQQPIRKKPMQMTLFDK